MPYTRHAIYDIRASRLPGGLCPAIHRRSCEIRALDKWAMAEWGNNWIAGGIAGNARKQAEREELEWDVQVDARNAKSSIEISGQLAPAYRRAPIALKSQSRPSHPTLLPAPPHPTPLLLPPPSLLLRPCLGSRSGPGRLGPGLGLSARAVTALLAPAYIRMPSAHNRAAFFCREVDL
jgi:hypothetical protein